MSLNYCCVCQVALLTQGDLLAGQAQNLSGKAQSAAQSASDSVGSGLKSAKETITVSSINHSGGPCLTSMALRIAEVLVF